MKPLTIEELKALPIGDWVWIVFGSNHHGLYWEIVEIGDIKIDVRSTDERFLYLCYDGYGTKWLAYKNKEQAEGGDEKVRKEVAKDIVNIMKQVQKMFYDGEYKAIRNIICERYDIEEDE